MKVCLDDWIYLITSIWLVNILLAMVVDGLCGLPTAFVTPADAQKQSLYWSKHLFETFACYRCTFAVAHLMRTFEIFWLYFHWQRIMVCHFCALHNPPSNRSARIFCLNVIAVIIFLKIISSIALQTLKWSRKLHIHLFMKNVFSLCVFAINGIVTLPSRCCLGSRENHVRPERWWRRNFTIPSCWI